MPHLIRLSPFHIEDVEATKGQPAHEYLQWYADNFSWGPLVEVTFNSLQEKKPRIIDYVWKDPRWERDEGYKLYWLRRREEILNSPDKEKYLLMEKSGELREFPTLDELLEYKANHRDGSVIAVPLKDQSKP